MYNGDTTSASEEQSSSSFLYSVPCPPISSAPPSGQGYSDPTDYDDEIRGIQSSIDNMTEELSSRVIIYSDI